MGRAYSPAGKRICCGYDNGAVKVMDLREGVSLVSLTGGQGHSKAVTCLDTNQDNMLLLTGSEDETAKLINSNNGKVWLGSHMTSLLWLKSPKWSHDLSSVAKNSHMTTLVKQSPSVT